MTKEQYLKVIERVIDSPRNDKLKITRLKNAFEQYVAETNERILTRLEEKENKYANAKLEFKGTMTEKSYEDRLDSIRYAIEIVKEVGGIDG